MFKTIFIAELKGLFRDRMYTFFAIYPVIFGGIGYFICDMLREDGNIMAANIVAMMLVVVTGYVFGALIAFTLFLQSAQNITMSYHL